MREEWINRIALTWANKTRQRKIRGLLDAYSTATEVVARYPELVSNEAIRHAIKEFDFIEKHSISTYFYKSADYPYRLSQCIDAPLLLYAKGNMNVNPTHVISVVGTRMPSERGKDWCRRLVMELAEKVEDVTIVSGGAYGIDIVAHKAALESGISTIIIPAHGLDRIYPAAHRSVAIQSLERGGLLTEYTCGTEPERYNFVARNRIVAGMADAVVVVESKMKGGSLITANMAIDYDREVFAVPGRVGDVCSEGCNDLIRRSKAQLITCADELIEDMQWQSVVRRPIQTSMVGLMCDLTAEQSLLLARLQESEEGLHVNQLVLETGLAYSVVSSELMMLELSDVVKSMPGGMWRVKK